MLQPTRRQTLLGLAGGALGLAGPKTAPPRAPAGAQTGASSSATTRPIPSSGEQLPVIGLGTWQSFDVGATPAERAPLEGVLRELAAPGGALIDSSPMYGRSEEVVGSLADAAGLRERFFLATKVWTRGKQAGRAQMEDSLRKLRTQRLDLLQVHNLLDLETHLPTLEQWKQAGRVRYLGLTHYTASAYDDVARALLAHRWDFLQINYSAVERDAEARLLPLARDRGVAVIANRPFTSGALLRRLRERPLPAWAGELGCQTWAQLLLKFVVSHPAITCAIPATANVAHLRENLQAGHGPLPDEKQRARIVEAVS